MSDNTVQYKQCKVRLYVPGDFPMITKWWEMSGELGPLEGMLTKDSTFICYVGDTPGLCVTLYLTNSPDVCYVENFVGNPEVRGALRRDASLYLSNYIAAFAQSKGYRFLLCLAHKEPLKQRYEELGFTRTLDNLSSFLRILSE